MIRLIIVMVLLAMALPGTAFRVAQAAEIAAPSTVDPGATVVIELSDASPGGLVEIWGPITQEGRGGQLGSVPATNSFATLTAPSRPGSYELRYVTPAGAVQARRMLDVASVPILLSVPHQLGAGIPGQVRWRGPARPGDRLQIVDPATGAVVSEAPAEGTPGAENATMLRAPQAMGDYHLRYVTGARNAVLRVLPIRVGPARTWTRSPGVVSPGESFPVTWHGPAEPGQRFEIFSPASGSVVASAAAEPGPTGVSARLRAPSRSGGYRLRVVNAETGQVYSDLPLRVSGG